MSLFFDQSCRCLLYAIVFLLTIYKGECFSKSYIDYLYRRYADDLSLHSLFYTQHEVKLKTNAPQLPAELVIYCEFLYIMLRELNSTIVMEVGGEFQTYWVSRALMDNAAYYHGNELPVLYTGSAYTHARIFSMPNLSLNVNIHHVNLDDLRSNWTRFDASQLDAVVVHSHEWSRFIPEIIAHIIQPTIEKRSDDLPAFGVFFYHHIVYNSQIYDADKSSKEMDENPDRTAARYDFAQPNPIQIMFKWIEGIKSMFPLDYQWFPCSMKAGENLQTTPHMNQIFNRSNCSAHKFLQSARNTMLMSKNISLEHFPTVLNENYFFGATIAPSPRLIIITPVSRVKMLPHIISSIDFTFVKYLVLVFDGTKDAISETNDGTNINSVKGVSYVFGTYQRSNPKIIELIRPSHISGAYGNPERNIGIEWVASHATEKEWGTWLLYFLDDDNVMHPNLLTLSQLAVTRAKMAVFGERSCFRTAEETAVTPIDPASCQFLKCDAAMALFPLFMVMKPPHADGPLLWVPDEHAADGEFMSALCDPQKIALLDIVATYHNGVWGSCDRYIFDDLLEPSVGFSRFMQRIENGF